MTDQDLREIFETTRTIAVVGFSINPERASNKVANFLNSKGYRVIPINPGLAGQAFLGEAVYADLASIPPEIEVDMVDIFRRSEMVPEVVAEALASLPYLRTVWMQLGVINDAAAAEARGAGKRVVMDRCPKIDYPRIMG